LKLRKPQRKDPADLEGRHNRDLSRSALRVYDGQSYRDQSTVCVMPCRDNTVDIKVEDAIDGLIKPMNQGFVRLNMRGFEVADAYNEALKTILANPQLSKFKFLLTVESDNLPPPDGLLRLIKHIFASCYAGIGGLYWTKGEGGMPMIYGDPREFPINFRPLTPVADTLMECRGIAMGFTLWDLELFKDKALGPPWFETKQNYDPAKGAELATQDLAFCAKACEAGYRFAVATDVKVGHVDFSTGVVW
jgi:hypothetical protein